MLIEIHMLQNHAPSNLNRDDTGSPKSANFGGYQRARISSQCLKRSIRRSDTFREELEGLLAFRTRRLPELVRERLVAEGISPEMAEIAAKKASGFGTREGTEQPKKNERYQTAQTMFLADADIHAVCQVMKEAAGGARTAEDLDKVAAKDLQASAELKGYRPFSVDIALFGRMITSEAFQDSEAAAQVAHAISTHRVSGEYDFFTAVDDLKDISDQEEDAGADMMGDTEFNSACYYKYFSIDTDALQANLTGERYGRADISGADRLAAKDVSARTLAALIKGAAMATPTGKQNSFAAHQFPSLILVEVRPRKIPVSYLNAFVKPASIGQTGNLVEESAQKLTAHAESITAKFNLEACQRYLLLEGIEGGHFALQPLVNVASLDEMAEKVAEVVRNG